MGTDTPKNQRKKMKTITMDYTIYLAELTEEQNSGINMGLMIAREYIETGEETPLMSGNLHFSMLKKCVQKMKETNEPDSE